MSSQTFRRRLIRTEKRHSNGLFAQRIFISLAQPFATSVSRFLHTLRDYDSHSLRRDVLAGLTVAVVSLPQAIAYAIIAGVPAEYGVYTVIIQSSLAAVFNSQAILSIGPINTQSLLTASVVTRLVQPQDPVSTYLQLVIGLTLIKGAIQLCMAELRLGRLVRYVSQSVIVGFTTGAGVLIIAGQVPGFLGIDTQRSAEHWPGLVGAFQRVWPHLEYVKAPAVILGTVSLVVLIIARRIWRLAPGPILAIGITGLTVWIAGLTAKDLTLMPEMPRSIPWPQLPSLTAGQMEQLLPGALALALLGLVEAYAIGKSLAGKTGARVDADDELFSQGIINAASSCFSCIPGSASFARSALNLQAGAATMLAGFWNALFVLLILFVGAPAAKYIPMSCVAAVLFVIAIGLVDWGYIRRVLATSRADAGVCCGTFLATLFLPLGYAVFIGVALNVAFYLRRASQLHIVEMVHQTDDVFMERPLQDHSGEPLKMVFLGIEGDLFFGVADELRDRLNAIGTSGARVVILRLKRTHSVDATIMQVLLTFAQRHKRDGGHVVLCGLRQELMTQMNRFGLIHEIGRDNVFEATSGVFASAKKAVRRARSLISESSDWEL